MRRLLVSSLVAIATVLGTSYGAFEYWVNLKANALPESITEGKLAEMTIQDAEQVERLTHLLAKSPLPWHQQQAERFNDLVEVAEAAATAFSNEKVSQLQLGQLLTLQQEMENYIQRYPEQAYAAELQEKLPAVRSMVTFYPIIQSSAGNRPVKSALQTSQRGATLAALVIRQVTDSVVAASTPPTTVASTPALIWSKAENDVLFDYAQALQPSERERISNDDRLKIGRQVCSWLETGQNYWGVRSMFDSSYRSIVQGNYYHNRDVYIQFGAERLCPQHLASLVRPPETSPVQVAKAPAPIAPAVTPVTTNTWDTSAQAPRWTVDAPRPVPYLEPVPGGIMPPPGFPGRIR